MLCEGAKISGLDRCFLYRIGAMKHLLCMTVIFLASSMASAQSHERWYSLLMSGQPAGWSRQAMTQEDGVLTSVTETEFAMRRGAVQIKIVMATRFKETLGGKPLEAVVSQTLGKLAMKQTFMFTEHEIQIRSEQGGRTLRQQLPLPKQTWLTPGSVEKLLKKQIAQGVKQIKFWTLEPSSGPVPLEVTMNYVGRENVQVMGKVVPSIVWDTQMSIMPGLVTRSWTDEQGGALKTTLSPMPGMDLTVVLADKQLATQQANPPELLVSTMIQPDRPLLKPRTLRRATYDLSITADDKALPVTRQALLTTSVQTVQWKDDHHVRVKVDLARPTSKAGKQAAIQGAAPEASYLRATPILNHEDPVVMKLIQKALPAKLPAAQQAERLRQFVHQFIETKDLSVGFATASEVAQTAQGDCSEHGVLLAAMLRGIEIPSRVVSGLIYVDRFLGQEGVFGYHMWTQAWLNGRWVDLDATLPGSSGFDAAHIALGVSSTDEGQTMNDLVRMLPLIGRLKIKVIEAR